MPDNTPPDLMKATADLLGAASDLVRAVSTAAPMPAPIAGQLLPPNDSLDSPAWYDLHHPEGSAGVHDLGEAYFDLHAPAIKDPVVPNKLHWDPAKGATWKDFARIGRGLFDPSQIFAADKNFLEAPFDALRLLQRMVGKYDVEQPDKLVTEAFPWPTGSGAFPPIQMTWTIRHAIAEYLSVFNVDPATGAVANRALDFPAAGGPLTLTHGQCVELRHVLFTQEDLRLVAPYDILGTLPW